MTGGNNALQTVGVEGKLKFVGIVGGDGGYIVAGEDGAFHEAHIVIELEHIFVEIALVQSEDIFQHLPAIAALILDIMDGEHTLGMGEGGLTIAVLQKIDGHKSGLPVVAMNHIGIPINLVRCLNNSPGEKCETLTIIIVAINAMTLEIAFIVHKIVSDTIPLQLEQTAVSAAPGQAHIVIL